MPARGDVGVHVVIQGHGIRLDARDPLVCAVPFHFDQSRAGWLLTENSQDRSLEVYFAGYDEMDAC